MSNLPTLMLCDQCTKPIEAEKGYFSSWIAWKRMDFHIQCRPNFTFAKEHRENAITQAKKVD